jgi:hypothetical protein
MPPHRFLFASLVGYVLPRSDLAQGAPRRFASIRTWE